MSELVSAYPTSGGIYWWASKLGGAKAGFFTGWLNLIGLVAVTAGVSYGCATFIDLTISTYSESYAGDYSLTRVFITFLVVLVLISVLNIFSSHLMAIMNNVSVWWHVVGASAIVLILIFVPDQHQSFSYVFTERFNNSGYCDGSTSSLGFWFAVVPFGFLLTQYTITGFDACAHLSEETSSASMAAAKGIWRSIFYSVLGGYILLLCVVFAIPNARGRDRRTTRASAAAAWPTSSPQSLGTNWATLVLFISASAQVFCATSCMTSASRMTFAFSRDGAIPGSSDLAEAHGEARAGERRDARGACCCAIVTLPALIEVNIGTADEPLIIPVAFYAVTSIAVIGLYLAFAIPIWLRWRHGENFEPGSWNNGSKYKWMNLIAVAEIVIVSVYLMMPFVPGANPFSDEFDVEVRQLRADRHARCPAHPGRSGGRSRRRSGSPGRSTTSTRVSRRSRLTERPAHRRRLSRGARASSSSCSKSGPSSSSTARIVLLHPPRPEVEVDRADRGLDRGPQGPAVAAPSAPSSRARATLWRRCLP